MHKQEERSTVMIDKEEWKIERIFCGMPNLLKYFQGLERNIKGFRRNFDFPQYTKERLQKKYATLLETARSLTGRELQIICYLRKVSCVHDKWVYHTLAALYEMECAFKNDVCGENIYENIFK